MKHGAILRASVTSQAGGVNYCPNPGPAQDVSQWAATSNGGPDLPTIEWTNVQPDANPIGDPGCGHLTWTGPNTGGVFPPGVVVPEYNVLAGNTYTLSCWVYVPSGSVPVVIVADGVAGTNTGILFDQWVRLSTTFTASADSPAMALWADGTPDVGQEFYWAGCLIQPGSTVGVYTNGGGQPGDPVQVLVDGSDSPVTANGLSSYIPSPGDRLLVQRVGGQMEVIQYISRGTVPYVVSSDLSDLQATVNSQGDQINNTSAYASTVNTDLQNYKSTTDSTLSTFQGAYDALTGVGNAGVQEDYMWVGDDPALSTVKSVQISTYVQGGLYAGDSSTFSTYFGLWDKVDLGDVTFSGTQKPPMTTFYTVFTNHSLSIVTGKDYGA